MRRLISWEGDIGGVTVGKLYPESLYTGCFIDDKGYSRECNYGKWEDVSVSTTEEHTGGSSSYYDLKIGTTTIKCLDIIEGLNMSYNEGNVFKAVWRIAAAKQGKCKKGNNKYYDSEKIVFFGERLLQEHKA